MKVNPLHAIPENLEKGDGDKDDSDSFKNSSIDSSNDGGNF